jgi:hypothetical protein
MTVLSSGFLRGQSGLRLWHCIILGLMFCSVAPAIAANPFRPLKQDSTTKSKTQQTVEVEPDNIRVQLTQCLREAEKVTCTFLVSSLKDDLTVWVSDPLREKSRLIDAEGNAYSSFEIVLFGKPDSTAMLVKQVPIRLVLSFTKLPDKISSAALLELGLETYGHEIPVRFQKVAFLNALAPAEPSSEVKEESPSPESTSPPETEEEPTQPEPTSPPETEEESPPPESTSPPETPTAPDEETTPTDSPQDTELPSEEAPPNGSSQGTELPEETQTVDEPTDKKTNTPDKQPPLNDSVKPEQSPKEISPQAPTNTKPSKEKDESREPSETEVPATGTSENAEEEAAPTEPNPGPQDTTNPEEAPITEDETEPQDSPGNPPAPSPTPAPKTPSQQSP